MNRATSLAVLALGAALAEGLGNGRAASTGRMPPMGYNTWNQYHCGINEDLMRKTADAMVSTGLLAAGYNFLNMVISVFLS